MPVWISIVQFVEDGNVAEVERDIDLFFQGHCSDHLLALAIRKFTVEYLEGLHAPGVQVACDKSVSPLFPLASITVLSFLR